MFHQRGLFCHQQENNKVNYRGKREMLKHRNVVKFQVNEKALSV